MRQVQQSHNLNQEQNRNKEVNKHQSNDLSRFTRLAGGEMISGTFDTVNQIMTLGDVVFDLSTQKKKGNKKE